MSEKISKNSSIILFSLFITTGLVLFALGIKADQTTSSASVTNENPTVSNVSINSAAPDVTLTENTTTTVTVTFTVTDNNGCQDIDSNVSTKTDVVFFRTDVLDDQACALDDANCYHMSCTGPTGCTPGGADLTATFSCTAPVKFYADATDTGATHAATNWTAAVTAYDGQPAGGPGEAFIEMNSLTALNVTASIAYGALALGGDTASGDQTTTVTNTGNRQIDIQLNGKDSLDNISNALKCTIGVVPVAYERYSLSSGTAWASKVQLTGTAFTETTFNLIQGAASTKAVYWGLGLPANGVGGSCSGKVDFAALNG